MKDDRINVILPVRMFSPNERAQWHWTKRARITRAQRETAYYVLCKHQPMLPCTVTITRIAPSSGLDEHDNLPGSAKPVVDGIADWLGVRDNDPRVTWRYAQERGDGYAARVTVVMRG